MNAPAINHIILTVSDLTRSRNFYGDVLGFEMHTLPDEFGKLIYFLCANGSSVWLIQHDRTPAGDRFDEFRIGLDHLAFTASSKAELDALAERLIAAGVPTQGVELFHGRWWYVCFRDPDNIQLEYWLDEPVGAK